jgi:hypothetical protein
MPDVDLANGSVYEHFVGPQNRSVGTEEADGDGGQTERPKCFHERSISGYFLGNP